MKKLMLMSLCVLTFSTLTLSTAQAAGCFCKITTGNSAGSSSPVGVTLKEYSNMGSWNSQIGHDSECRNNCSQAVHNDPNKSNIMNQAKAHLPAGAAVNAYSAVGSKKYEFATKVGNLPSATGTTPSPILKPGGVQGSVMCTKPMIWNVVMKRCVLP